MKIPLQKKFLSDVQTLGFVKKVYICCYSKDSNLKLREL